MSPQERLIARLMTVYGEPKTNDPGLYIEEFDKAVQGWSAEILDQAGDEVIRKCTFWPRPAEIIERCESIAAAREARKPRREVPEINWPPPTPEQRERSREIMRRATAVMRGHMTPEQVHALPSVDRVAFEKLQRESPNTHLHVDHSVLSRRITGERE